MPEFSVRCQGMRPPLAAMMPICLTACLSTRKTIGPAIRDLRDEPERDVDPGPQAVPSTDARDTVVGERGSQLPVHIAFWSLWYTTPTCRRASPAPDEPVTASRPTPNRNPIFRLSEPSPDVSRGLVAAARGTAGEACGEPDEGPHLLTEVRQVDVVRGPGGDRGLLHHLVAQQIRVRGNDGHRLPGRHADVDAGGAVGHGRVDLLATLLAPPLPSAASASWAQASETSQAVRSRILRAHVRVPLE